MSPSGHSRRDFLKRAGAVAVAAGSASGVGYLASPARAATLGEGERRTLGALVEALAETDSLDEIDAARAGEAADALASRYEEETDEVRANIDALLAAVEETAEPQSFAGHPPAARLELLRRRLRQPVRGLDGESLPNPVLLDAAIGLAVDLFYPDALRLDSAAAAIL